MQLGRKTSRPRALVVALVVLAGLVVISSRSEGVTLSGTNGLIAVDTGPTPAMGDGVGNITAINPQTGARGILAGTVARDAHPEINPAGTKVAYDFTAEAPPADTGAVDIFTDDFPAGGNPVNITDSFPGGGGPNTDPAWSPNGQAIVYQCATSPDTNSTGNICVISPPTAAGTITTLVGTDDGVKPDFSPDGAFVVFSTVACGPVPGTGSCTAPGITRVNFPNNATTPNATHLFETTGGDDHPRIAPDGSVVYFDSCPAAPVPPAAPVGCVGTGISSVAWPNGGARVTLTGTVAGDDNPVPSPDGKFVAFTDLDTDGAGADPPVGIVTVDAPSGGNRKAVLGTCPGGPSSTPCGGPVDFDAAWQRVGAAGTAPPVPPPGSNGFVAVESSVTTAAVPPGDGPLVAINPSTGARTILAGSSGADNFPNVSPDGRKVAFENSGTIFVSDFPSGSTRKQVTSPSSGTFGTAAGCGGGPTWHPTLQLLVFCSASGLHTAPANSNEPGPVTFLVESTAGDSDPTFSPNGQFVYFHFPGGLGRVDSTGTGRRTILAQTSGGDTHPRITPNSTTIFFKNVNPGGIITKVAYPDGGSRLTLATSQASDFRPFISPDAQLFAFENGSSGIFFARVDGSGARAQLLGTSSGDIHGSWARLVGQTPTNAPTPSIGPSPSGSPGAQCPGHIGESRPQAVGTTGNDVLNAPRGGIACGQAGNDVLIADPNGNSLLEGGDGTDILCARQNASGDSLDGGSGVDRGRYDNPPADDAVNIERLAAIRFCAT